MTTLTLHERYIREVQPKLTQELGVKNCFALPKITKVICNVGLGELKGNEPLQKVVEENIRQITGQKPIPTRSKKAIAGFKLRQGDQIGFRVTLRGKRMYDLLDRLITIVLPRIRDFHGLPKEGFDKSGNYSMGLRESAVFPEVPFESSEKSHGLQLVIVTTAQDSRQAELLLKELGLPFAK